MKQTIRILLLLLIGYVPFALEAQTPPAWLYPQVREASYPTDVYFSEFTEGNLRAGEDVSTLLDRLKSDAKRGTAGNIRTLIESVVEKTERQTSCGQDLRFNSVYQDFTRQTASADIANIYTMSYYDEQRRRGYAFAYVEKIELVAYYRAQISNQLQQVENAITLSASLFKSGQKAHARKVCEDALSPLSKVEFAQDLITAIVPGDTTGMQQSRFAQDKKTLLQSLIDLEQSIYVYFHCTETNFGQTVRILGPELKRILTNEQCSLTDEPEEADFVITVTASTREHDGNVVHGDGVNKFSFADVEVEVYNNLKQKVVYSESVSVKNNGDGATYESAGRNALKRAAGKVWEGMRPWVIGK